MSAARLVMVGLLLGAPVLATPPPKQARDLYHHGMTQYSLRNFDGAIADFKAAYELTREPGLLFDIAQASRLARRMEEALYFYRAYLRERPSAPNRRDVETLIDQLAATVPPPPPAVAVAPVVVAPPPAAVPPPPRLPVAPRRPSGRVELGVGVALLGAAVGLLSGGVALGVAANRQSERISASATSGGAWTPELRAQWDSGQRDSAAATALYVVGGVAGAAGVTLTVIGARRMHGRLSAGAAPGQMQVAWTCAF